MATTDLALDGTGGVVAGEAAQTLTSAPALAPTSTPTVAPSSAPALAPTSAPTVAPSSAPRLAPSTDPAPDSIDDSVLALIDDASVGSDVTWTPVRPEVPWAAAMKRGFDILGATAGLILLAPLFLLIALIIKLSDPGPVFYRHRRLSWVGRPIYIYKFRTMKAKYSTGEFYGGRTDAEIFAELGRPELVDEFVKRQKLRDDPRVSSIGAFLRRTSLDELPQLWNILRGDISTVGPRPVVAAELQHYGDECGLLLSLKPGLTGLWQISGRSDLDYADRVRLDLQYASTWTLLLDLKIVLRTVVAVVKGHGAY